MSAAGPVPAIVARLRRFPARSQDDLRLEAQDVRYLKADAWMPALQEVLRPGGRAVLAADGDDAKQVLSSIRNEARHYFHVDRPAPASGGALRLVVRRRPTAEATAHFETLAPEYWDELPTHVQQHFLAKKLALLREFLPDARGARGLDLGCGVGRYAVAVQAALGAHVVGVDPTRRAVADARRHAGSAGPMFLAGDALRLPFADAAFDFAYTINVLHHLKRGEQERALAELHRVTRPHGRLVVHEMNTRNPLFAWYLRHVYPRVRRIDRGDEEFIDPRRWPLGDQWKVRGLRYMTFVPDFAPRWMLGPLQGLELRLERTRAAKYAVHYAVVLERRD